MILSGQWPLGIHSDIARHSSFADHTAFAGQRPYEPHVWFARARQHESATHRTLEGAGA